MADLRIFSYLPNPRVWKATIAARFCGVDVELRGASGRELRDWLWDYDAHPLAEHERQSLSYLERMGRVGLTGVQLFKTDAFLEARHDTAGRIDQAHDGGCSCPTSQSAVNLIAGSSE